MFVSVEMGDVDAGLLEAMDLGECFAHDIFFADTTGEEIKNKVEQRRAESFTVGSEERGDAFGRRGGDAVGEDDVTADAESRVGVGDGDRVLEGWSGGHEGGGGEGFGLVKLGDRAVDAGSEAEVVRVDDESGSHRKFRAA